MELLNHLTIEQKKIIEVAVRVSKELNMDFFLVGGAVRDFCLGKAIHDLDICVEGNGMLFAQKLREILGGDLRVHKEFLTSTIITPSKNVIDIITTRKEAYPTYGALPTIKAGSILDDLKRRDFSINAIALNINTNSVIDPTGGLLDIKKRLIRILHKESFLEDPTRILRSIRFSQRLSFKLENETKRLLKTAIPYLENVSPKRRMNEFIKIINEGKTKKILNELESHGINKVLLPGTNLKLLSLNNINFIKNYFFINGGFNLWLSILMLIYWECSKNINNILNLDWEFTKNEKNALNWLVENNQEITFLLKYNQYITDLHLHRIFHNSPQEAEVFILSILGNSRNKVAQHIKSFKEKSLQLPISGKEIIQNGIPPGPIVGMILNKLENEVLQGNIQSKTQALDWLKRIKKDVD